MTSVQPVAAGPGIVVLAAFRPVASLFTTQLRSLQAQTRNDFRCLIGADGDWSEIVGLVRRVVGDDPRFEVVGWDDNVGFYLNFERLLALVPEDVSWVGLSDQDDHWYPDKLERLVPCLNDITLVSGQARVISSPEGQILSPSTGRRVVSAEDLFFRNQVTGSLSLFRRELLALALPFPRLRTASQLHDHWLGLCAAVSGGYRIIDEVVQDYVQHGGNHVGEHAVRERWTPVGFLRRAVALAETYEGDRSIRACARAYQRQTFEWRRSMLGTLGARTELPPGLARVRVQLNSNRPLRDTVGLLARAARSPATGPLVAATFLPGVPFELLQRWSD